MAMWCAFPALAEGSWDAKTDQETNAFEPDQPEGAQPSEPATQSWVGAEGTANVWSIYSGLTWAPLGSIREDGWRIRMTGGYGQYHYKATVDGERQTVHGTASYGDLLAGYQKTMGNLTLKAFIGGSFDGHLLTPFDTANPVSDRMIGVKGVLEGWLEMGPSNWTALDLSWSAAHDTYFSRLRVGHRINRNFSIGPEAGAYGNRASDNGRAGLFARYEWEGGEVSASAGVTGDIAKPTTPYATLVYLSRL